MAISLVSSSIAASDTVAIGTHAAGDLIVGWAFAASTGAVGVGSGFEQAFGNVIGNTVSRTIAFQTATSSSEAFGTWSSAQIVGSAVFRSDIGSVLLGGANSKSAPGLTLFYSDAYARRQANRIFAVGAARSLTTDIATPPSGFSLLDTTNDGSSEAAQFLSDDPTTVGFQTNQTLTGTTSSGGIWWSELQEIATGGGGGTPSIINPFTQQVIG
jgi:hypothetical protein